MVTSPAFFPEDPSAAVLESLLGSMPGLSGAVYASTDGHPIAARLSDRDPGASAAVVASACALGERLASLVGTSAMRELVVRSDDGYAAVYMVGADAVLTVLTTASANVARLHLNARSTIASLESIAV